MERKLLINQDYLYLPIKAGKAEQLIEIFEETNDNLTKVMEWMVPVGEEEGESYSYDYKAALPVKLWKGKTLVLKGQVPENFYKEVEHTSLFAIHKENRPSIHFTADTGWINDPNGLVYADGVYHLYFQYNPCNTSWQNMSWGHAVSRDLLHWEQRETVLLPDKNGTMFSGCGLKNERALLGLPKEALLFFYTAAGDNKPWGKEKNFTQRMAYSIDGGQNLIKMPKPCLDTVTSENRDPKIFWHEETKGYVMSLWLEGNDFAIFRSTDLENWEMTDRFTLDEAWECPDLMKLYDEAGSAHWLFWSADGFYFWGEFDGYKFTTDGKRHLASINKVGYAAQTYSGIEGRTVSVSWLRLENRGRLYTGAMGLPREFSVKVREGNKYLVQAPIRELMMQRKQIWHKEIAESQVFKYSSEKTQNEQKALQIEMILDEANQEPIVWQINGSVVSYLPQTGEFIVDEVSYPIGKGQTKLSFLVDRHIFEVGVDRDIMTGIFELKEDLLNVLIPTNGVDQLEVYEII